MATNLELRVAYLEKRLQELISAGFKAGEAINEVSYLEVTEKTGDLIRTAYDELNSKIQVAKKQGKSDVMQKLIDMKKDVPKKYAVTKESMKEFVNLLNSLVPSNSS